MPDIFVSYAREDESRVRPLVRLLETGGWDVFWDRTIPPGETWHSWIGRNLDQASFIMVAWSEHSIGSDWVREEADEGKRRSVLIPLLIDDVLPPLGHRSVQASDLIGWDGDPESPKACTLVGWVQAKLGQPVTAESMVEPKVPRKAAKSPTPIAQPLAFPVPEVVALPGGRLQMGSPETEEGRTDDEAPIREVRINPFAMGRYPVTNAEFRAFKADHDSGDGFNDDLQPAVNVSWVDAVAYTDWLSNKTDKKFRLPTEGEWEFAARAGATTRYWWGNDIQQDSKVWANCDGCGSKWDNRHTAPVGQFPAKSLWPARHRGQHLRVGRGLLAQ